MYIGSIIGAGFASGQEIMQFFIVFGDKALYGIILSTILFAYLGSATLYLSSLFRTTSYKKLFANILSARLGKLMDIISMIMLFLGLGIMFSGSGAVFSEHMGLPSFLGVALTAGITCAVICGGLQRVLLANAYLVPVKVFLIIIVCIWILGGTQHVSGNVLEYKQQSQVAGNWAWAAVLYVSYNMIVSVAVLASLGSTVSRGQGLAGGITGGVCLGLVAGIITAAGLQCLPSIADYQVPLLYMAERIGFIWKKLLTCLIWLAILTTAIANAHGFSSRLAPSHTKKYKVTGVAVTFCTVPMAGIDFTQLVKTVYPLFGYAGLVLVVALILSPLYKFFSSRGPA